MQIRLVLTGRGYDRTQLPERLDLAAGATISAALATIQAAIGSARLPASTLVILSGRHLGTVAAYDDAPLAEGDEIMLLQPVAGG